MKRLTKKVMPIVLVFGILAAGCTQQEPPAKEEIPPVRTKVVASNTEGTPIVYAGEVIGRNESRLSFQVGGKITKRYVEVGDVVQAGDLLMEIDTTDLQQDVVTQEANIAAIQSNLQLAEENLQRYQLLLQSGAVSNVEVDSLQTARDITAEQLKQAQSGLERTKNQVHYGRLVAPASGIVSAIRGEVGQVINPNHPGSDVLTLVLDNEREVAIDVPERQLADMQNAGKIKIKFWALPDVTVDGVIRDISPVADKATRTYQVKISSPNLPQAVKYGMSATVEVYPANPSSTITVPLSSIYQTGNDSSVWVVQDNVVHLRPIKVGTVMDNKVEVLEGLNDGETVVTAGVHKLQPGQAVRVTTGGGQ
ncbi:efflux RND transporter periplasmic adaptor subunit [Heliophilum fasciatum]|uniref:RND family efflux transporter MFP subunit n=1 Tax=Heliophilum fasciatum TaxID=35700 RepID=A0A4R2RY33_9FIRM|nr:efflux RND transporter periplasmic adaptor subunit [Heliophilum fasciatum]MCW2276991.1 RND family efflux transporter MFP subunit [Heliophilum fasciatum]TCP68483.1 RND family efflux transporter MFP subunit [Heliophilum fasciatum]